MHSVSFKGVCPVHKSNLMYVLDWMEWSRTLGQAHGLRLVDKTIILLILNLSLS